MKNDIPNASSYNEMKVKIVFDDNSRLIIGQSWSIEDIVQRFVFEGWEPFFESQRENIHHISETLQMKCPDFIPFRSDVFRVFSCKPTDIKVVIVGQDPYHTVVNGLPTAVGLSFSRYGVNPSLNGIYKELRREYPEYAPGDGSLTHWFEQGVFLVNTALTVKQSEPGSHIILWKSFTDAMIRYIRDVNSQCVYMLWGAPSRKLIPIIGHSGRILETSHPSPMSFNKGFYGCNHFRLCNDILRSWGKEIISW